MTQKPAHESGEQPLDTKLLSNLIYQINIVRRQVSTYPPGHQVIVTSAIRTLKILERLKPITPQITIGIARDRLMLGSNPLDPQNPVYREFARALFSHGLVALTIRHGLTSSELCRFCSLLGNKPQDLLEKGGITQMSAASGIEHIAGTPLDYRRFHTRQIGHGNDTVPLNPTHTLPTWEQFVSSLMLSAKHQGAQTSPPMTSPAALAMNLNSESHLDTTQVKTDYDKAIATFLRDLDREDLSKQVHDELLDKFRIFVTELQPHLRNQFLASTFSSIASQERQANSLFEVFPKHILLNALNDLNTRQTNLPPFILQLLSQLSHTAPHPSDAQEKGSPPEPVDTSKLFNQVFSEHRVENYVPDDYQTILRHIPNHRTPTTLPPAVVADLKKGLDEQSIEKHLAAVVSHLLQNANSTDRHASLKQQLSDLIQHFIATGDFSAIIDLHRQLSAPSSQSIKKARDLRAALFSGYRFTRDIVHSLVLWPANKRQIIFSLIHQVGPPFIPQLLDQLAEERVRSARFQLLKLLADMGPAIREQVTERLHDSRWYFVRNLVVLLRGLDDPALMHNLAPLLNHPHERVRQETLKTAFHFRDPRADNALLKELHRRPEGPPEWAINLAGHCQDKRILCRLLKLMSESGLNKEGLAVQLAIVTTLGKIGDPIALNDLARVLFGFSVCHPYRHRRLQYRIVETLKNYPPESSAPVYRRLARSARPDLAELRLLAAQYTPGAVP